MIAPLYSRLYATSVRLLFQYGAAATLTRTTSGAYDPVTASTPDTRTDYAVSAAVFDFTADEVDGTLVLRTDKKALISPDAAVVPQPADSFTWQGKVHMVVAVEQVSPAGAAVLYKAQVRG